MRRTIGTILVASALALGGCDNDDDGGPDDMAGGMGGDPDPTVPGGMGGMEGMEGTPPVSGDIFALAARMDGDDPAPLDRATLQGQLDSLLGDADADDPLSLEEGDTALTALQRRRDMAR